MFPARLSLIFVLREAYFLMAVGYGSDIASISEKTRCEKTEFVDRLSIRWTVLQNGNTARSSVAKCFSPNDRMGEVFEVFLLADDRRRFVVVFPERVSGVQDHDRVEFTVNLTRLLN